jgi:ABC-type antimicrobial peptide transport system permease subunit
MLPRSYAKDASDAIVKAYENSDYSIFDADFLNLNYYDALDVRNYLVGSLDLAKKYDSFAKVYLSKDKSYQEKDYNLPTNEVIESLLDYKIEGKYYLQTDDNSYELIPIGYTDSNNIFSIYYLKEVTQIYEDIRINYYSTDYQDELNAKYDFAITRTNYSQAQIKNLLQTFDTYKYAMTNQVYMRVSAIVSTIDTMQKVFLIIVIVFAVFASLMLSNFISSSISSNIKEIGILRAIGTRGSDLFKIFFSESGIIAIVCFTISVAASNAICIVLNNNMASGLGIKLLNFNYINALIIVGGSLVIALNGTFISVFIVSKKSPIESIRTL